MGVLTTNNYGYKPATGEQFFKTSYDGAMDLMDAHLKLCKDHIDIPPEVPLAKQYFLHLPTAAQELTVAYATITGATVSITPTRADTYLRYSLRNLHVAPINTSDAVELSFRLFVDGVDFSAAPNYCRAHYRLGSLREMEHQLLFIIPSTGVVAREFKVKARNYSTGTECQLGETQRFDGVSPNQVLVQFSGKVEEVLPGEITIT
jgi:hypothetical protein